MKRNSQSQNFVSVRKQQLLEANKDDDKAINRLEKLLKLNKKNKKKSTNENCKKIPSMFVDDGLDYLLEVVDRKDGELHFSDSSIDEDLNTEFPFLMSKASTSLDRKRKLGAKELIEKIPPKKQRTLTELLKEKEGSESDNETESNCSEVENQEDLCSVNSSDDDDEQEIDDFNSKTEPKNQKPKQWEDIYGRIRDEDGNVVITEVKKGLYVPPAMRTKNENMHQQKQEELLKIRRQLKGLLNRLSESNLQPICKQIEEMYMKNSRNDMNETMMSLLSELVLSPILTPPRLMMEQSMLISLLHANIGPEVGAYFMQNLAIKLDRLLKMGENYGEIKECNNVLVFLCHLYNFKVTHSMLIFDIFRYFVNSFQEKDIELIQLLLISVGFNLRKDNPLLLKEIILDIQVKAPAFKVQKNDSRVNFMLETLTAIRNNNMYKIPDYDPSIVEHAKKMLRGFVRKGSSQQELSISFDDLLKAEERGRWWIVGSAWSERDSLIANSTTTPSDSVTLLKTDVNEKILALAQKQHMNTEVRKAVFCIIMTAEDFMDAFEKLLRLNLKNQQEREIINIILHCVLQEKSFNPYYAYLAGKFCSFARKYFISLQFSLWDKFKEMANLKSYQVKNLAHFLTHLFITGALPLSVLKVIHLSEMDKTMVGFFRQILSAILLHESEELCRQAFTRIASAKNLNLLREGLKLFMHHFILRSKFKPDVAQKLAERVEMAERILNSAKRTFKL